MLPHEICCNRKIKTCCNSKLRFCCDLIESKMNFSLDREAFCATRKSYVCLLISERIPAPNLLSGLRLNAIPFNSNSSTLQFTLKVRLMLF